MGGGWVREVENKAKLSPAGAGAWAELGNKNVIGNYMMIKTPLPFCII